MSAPLHRAYVDRYVELAHGRGLTHLDTGDSRSPHLVYVAREANSDSRLARAVVEFTSPEPTAIEVAAALCIGVAFAIHELASDPVSAAYCVAVANCHEQALEELRAGKLGTIEARA